LLKAFERDYPYRPSTWKESMGDLAKLPRLAKRVSLNRVQKELSMLDLSKSTRDTMECALAFNRLKSLHAKKLQSATDFEMEGDQIGGLAFVVWDDLSMPATLVEHFEQDAYNNGEGSEQLFRFNFAYADPTQWRTIVSTFKAFAEVFVAFSKLVSSMEVDVS